MYRYFVVEHTKLIEMMVWFWSCVYTHYSHVNYSITAICVCQCMIEVCNGSISFIVHESLIAYRYILLCGCMTLCGFCLCIIYANSTLYCSKIRCQ